MPWDGTGTFVSLGAPDYPAVAGEVIYAERFNAVIDDLITGLNEHYTKGQAFVQYIALSDLTSVLLAGTNKAYYRAGRPFTIEAVRASVLTASSSGLVTVDINKNGVSILSTKLTIDSGEKTSVTAAAAVVISTPNIGDDDEISFDVDGAGTGAVGLIVMIRGRITA